MCNVKVCLLLCRFYKRWEEALPHMSKGEQAKIIVPPQLAYGDRGYPPVIPPNAKIAYTLELLSISSAKFYDKVVAV